MLAKDHLGTPNILFNSRSLLKYLYEGLTRSISITFSFVSFVSNASMLARFIFKTFV